MVKKLVYMVTMIIGLTAMVTYGVDIYVSPTGNDSQNGSKDSPLKTLKAARDKADQVKSSGAVRVFLRGGTYYLDAPVEFGPSNSGTESAPIKYVAYGSEKPVISGGIKVDASWQDFKDKIKVATIDKNLKVDQLFLNGKRQILARYPNYVENEKLNGTKSDCCNRKYSNPTEGPGYIRALHDGEWGGNSYIVTGSDLNKDRKWVGDNNRGSIMHSSHRMVENFFEDLDAPGEWFYRKSTGQLFFYPPDGTNLGSATIELASQDELLRFIGKASDKVKFITFKGIQFTHTYRTLFSKPYETMLRGDWCIARAGAVFMENAENIRIEHCYFNQIGGNGVFISGYNRKHVIYNNNFQHTGASCVVLFGWKSSNWCPAISHDNGGPCDNYKDAGPKTDEYPAFVTIDNNTMYNLGVFEKQTAGVCISMAQHDTVRRNEIHKMPRAGINFTDGCYGGHMIENNWVYESVLETGDHGPFNAWGRDRIARNSGKVEYSRLDAQYPTIVRNNRFEVRSPYFGIDLDDQASNYTQYNNLCFGGGLKLQWNRYNTYTNNILVNSATVEIHLGNGFNNTHHYLARNIIVGKTAYCLNNKQDDGKYIKANTDLLDSNIIYNEGNDPIIGKWLNPGSSIFSWGTWKSAGLDAHSKTNVDPKFKDPSKGDYTVTNNDALSLGFKNFPMDFGTKKVDYPTEGETWVNTLLFGKKTQDILNFKNSRLIVSCENNFQVTIMTTSGRTVKVLNGKGTSNFTINLKTISPGLYMAVLKADGQRLTQQILVN